MFTTRNEHRDLFVDVAGFTIRCQKDPDLGGYVASVLVIDYFGGRAETERGAIRNCLLNNIPIFANTVSASMRMLEKIELAPMENYGINEAAELVAV